jgi:4-diphosphocytidyl-2-C-methyl-D-erythritol kinase
MTAARIRAFAKINLSLEVLNRRPDGYHNLRTVFQTISLADVIRIDASRSRSTHVSVDADIEIPGENLMVRAAHAVLEACGVPARVRMTLQKKIPMGGGLGGGSSDAAAVLLALPRLLHKPLPFERLMDIGARLGSDVPVFLIGGTVLGLGRGTELYPLPDIPTVPVLVVSSGVHVPTAEAYRSLGRGESEPDGPNRTSRLAQALADSEDWTDHCWNDFEAPVFTRHPELAGIRRKLSRLGAKPARMTGSGSAIFGVFSGREERDRASVEFPRGWARAASVLPRWRYRSAWVRALEAVC